MTSPAPTRASSPLARKPDTTKTGRRPAWLTYVLVGFLGLVVMPVGAAMVTIYLSKSTDRAADLIPPTTQPVTLSADETGR